MAQWATPKVRTVDFGEHVRKNRTEMSKPKSTGSKNVIHHHWFQWGAIALLLFVVAVLCVLWLLATPYPGDLTRMNNPLYEPVLLGKTVSIEPLLVNGAKPPGDSLKVAVEIFSKYTLGDVKLVEPREVEVGDPTQTSLSLGKTTNVIAQRKCTNPSDITIVFAHLFDFLDPNARGQTRYPGFWSFPNVTNMIVLIPLNRNKEYASTFPYSSYTKAMVNTITHELYHTLNLPFSSKHFFPDPEKLRYHCANPWCCLYPKSDRRSVSYRLLNWGDVNELCENCNKDLEMAKKDRSVLVYDQRKFDSREIRWDNVVTANPDRWEAYHQRGKHHFDTERYDEAIEDFNRVIVLDPDNAAHYYHRGLVHIKLGNTVEAASDFEKANEIDPGNTGLLATREIEKLGNQNQ
jgi:hypothetical protein